VLLGCAAPAHILTPSATVRRIVNMVALTVVEANAARQMVNTVGAEAIAFTI
jgi:malate dehydrogenase (oxaloacetate-decarboxylating)(NADP+)